MINLVNISSGRILLACLILVVFVAFCSSCSSKPHIMFSDYPKKDRYRMMDTTRFWQRLT